MKDESIILFVFEGEKTEVKVYENLKLYFSKFDANTHIYTTFDTHIYELYWVLQKDSDKDIVELIRDRNEQNRQSLANISRDSVAEVYLFFDYDGHVPVATNEILMEMIEYFDNETEAGKLYISYPMVEALKHVHRDVDFKETIVEINSGKSYKTLVGEECGNNIQDLTKLTLSNWNWIIEAHGKKLNYIVNDDFIFPGQHVSQIETFRAQLEKYITPVRKVAVLSAFPILIIDYYGVNKIKQKLVEHAE
ncbi:conserved hypothetical protein [Bathymodiolus platifrons methanotrophic gill symbiont]|uniref:hypothetical protein n=1 Tax=unclassified Gammaproteobacteria TaxID=33811 RepID=UPI000B4132AC|nr:MULTISPECIES: hypothetical protein [unclassified Gammaproteobacteria]GAW86654.1 conserved hypothetical protein [Bathymodiolus platifrons methanotrophic gill symbiont]GFO72821.1 hypothetical protein BJAS_P3334 [Bathymodiolus japonicus methanotrophic gill symbiont]GFO76341.1 hypothetical protein BPLS_P4063 [Bathymodiolus platifrons methanotrophic gill symbiont]